MSRRGLRKSQASWKVSSLVCSQYRRLGLPWIEPKKPLADPFSPHSTPSYCFNPAMQGINAVYKDIWAAFETLSGYALEPEVGDGTPQILSRFGKSPVITRTRFPWPVVCSFPSVHESHRRSSRVHAGRHGILDQEDRDIAYKSQFAGWAAFRSTLAR